MFGKPNWFQVKFGGWGLLPCCWQGWTYTATWLAVVAAPFLLFQILHQAPESYVWLAAALGGVIWDVRELRRAMAGPATLPKDVFVIDDDTDISQLTTQNFDMNLRK